MGGMVPNPDVESVPWFLGRVVRYVRATSHFESTKVPICYTYNIVHGARDSRVWDRSSG